jgi:hypothetical protein
MKALLSFVCLSLLAFCVFSACNKNNNPNPPPVTDTVTITKTDTITVPPAPDPTVNLTKGLLLYLPFNGNINDSSGNNNPTYAVGDVLTYDAHGYVNSAFNGNGINNHVVVTNNGSIKFDTAFSVSFDFMTTVPAAGTRQSLIAMVDTVDGFGPSFLASLSLPGQSNLDFYVNDVTANCDLAGNSPVNDPAAITDTLFVPQLNTWYNMIVLYSQGSITTFINGTQVDYKKRAGTAALLCPQSSIVIGGWWNGDLIPLNGKMDEVRLYDRTLTAHEIVALSQHYQVTSEKVQARAVHGR